MKLQTYATERLTGDLLKRAFAMALGWEYREGKPEDAAPSRDPLCDSGMWRGFRGGNPQTVWTCMRCSGDVWDVLSASVAHDVLHVMNEYGVQISWPALAVRGGTGRPERLQATLHTFQKDFTRTGAYVVLQAEGATVEEAVMRVFSEFKHGPQVDLLVPDGPTDRPAECVRSRT